MADLPQPISRRDQQRLTREALVFAARAVFARDGYHGANLEGIAREAGFSKGAVYSNFESKAALFLAVMDLNIAAAARAPEEGRDDGLAALIEGRPEFEEAVRGFALATLEFIATAARDKKLSRESGKRMAVLLEGYARAADHGAASDAELSRAELGALLAALDQGSAVLALAGADAISERALQVGMQRLADVQQDEGPGHARSGSRTAFHSRDVRRQIAASIAEEAGSGWSEPGHDRS